MRAFAAWRDRRRNRATYRAIAHLNDNMLSDIGLSRTTLDALRRGYSPIDR